MASRALGMIFLDTGHENIREVVYKRLTAEKREAVDVKCSDFDDVTYHITSSEDLATIKLSIKMRIFEDLKNFGAEAILESDYKGLVVPTEDGYDLSIAVNLDSLPEKADVIAKKFSELKRNIVGAPFTQCFASLLDGTSGDLPPISIDYREKETIYIVPGKGNIAIIFSFDFPDATDAAIGRVFLQEFSEVRKVNGAPPCNFSRDPPRELKGMKLREATTCVGYLSFSILDSAVKGAKLHSAVTLLSSLRDYVNYHIKASKTYLHYRMRQQCNSLQQVLNRAKPETVKEKKLMSGKTFNRK